MYFGTPQSTGLDIECFQPCGVCHVVHRMPDYYPNVNNPQNNESVTDVSVTASGHLLLSAQLTGLRADYINSIMSTHRLNVALPTIIPQDLADEACDRAGVPHFEGTVLIPPHNYGVVIPEGADMAHLNAEGTYTAASGWSWTFSIQ